MTTHNITLKTFMPDGYYVQFQTTRGAIRTYKYSFAAGAAIQGGADPKNYQGEEVPGLIHSGDDFDDLPSLETTPPAKGTYNTVPCKHGLQFSKCWDCKNAKRREKRAEAKMDQPTSNQAAKAAKKITAAAKAEGVKVSKIEPKKASECRALDKDLDQEVTQLLAVSKPHYSKPCVHVVTQSGHHDQFDHVEELVSLGRDIISDSQWNRKSVEHMSVDTLTDFRHSEDYVDYCGSYMGARSVRMIQITHRDIRLTPALSAFLVRSLQAVLAWSKTHMVEIGFFKEIADELNKRQAGIDTYVGPSQQPRPQPPFEYHDWSAQQRHAELNLPGVLGGE
jgi:hypothetical protein